MTDRKLIQFKPAYVKPAWPCATRAAESKVIEIRAEDFTSPDRALNAVLQELIQRANRTLREREADIVLAALALHGGDARDLHQQIHPDRTIYLLAGTPLVEVSRPHFGKDRPFTPGAWMDNVDGPGALMITYRLLFTPTTEQS